MKPSPTPSQPDPLVSQATTPGLSDELAHYKTQLAAIERVSHTLFQSIDLDELVETTLRIALEEVNGEAGSILLADFDTQQLVFQYSIGEKPVPRGTAIAWNSGISGAVFQSGSARLTTRMDEQAGYVGGTAVLKHRPSEYLTGGRFFSSIERHEGEEMFNMVSQFLGDHVLMYASDYPHSECQFPNSVDNILCWSSLKPDTKRQLLWDNASRFYKQT